MRTTTRTMTTTMSTNTSTEQRRHHRVTQQEISDRVAMLRQRGLGRSDVEDEMDGWRKTLRYPRLTANALDRRIIEAYKLATETATQTDVIEAVLRTVFRHLPSPPSLARLAEWLDQYRAWLSGLDPVVKELLRPKLVERLERLKVENATRIVAAVLRHQQPDKANLPEHQGQSISLPTIEPAVDPVDGDQLLTDLAATFEKYVFLPKHASTALALAVVMAHTHDIQTISPMIAVVSPEPECGKTTLLLVGKAVMPRALLNADITKATLFRMIEKYHPSLLVDEADSIFKDNDDLRSVFNASHVRKSAVVPRTVGDHHEPQLFSTWCPKWLALIGKLPPTLEGRSIIIRMRRRTWKDQVERLRQDRI